MGAIKTRRPRSFPRDARMLELPVDLDPLDDPDHEVGPVASCSRRVKDRLMPLGEHRRPLGEPTSVDQAHTDEISHMRSILVAIR